MSMQLRSGQIFLILAFGIGTLRFSWAEGLAPKTCAGIWPEPFSIGQPFHLKDPRSKLILHIEHDGRHTSAINTDGKTVWHRDVFSDPKLVGLFPQVPQIPGEPYVSPKQWRREMQSYVAKLGIDRIGIEPDCMMRFIDHDMPSRIHGHYIRAGSGTHIFWLLDAKTGDLQMEEVN